MNQKTMNYRSYGETAGIVQIQRRIHMGIIAAAAILLTIGGVLVVQANSSQMGAFNGLVGSIETHRPERVRYYKSIQVQPGDSLWSIAKVYRTEEFSSIYAYIQEIYELNELQSETIWAGSYLMVICYKDVV